MLKQLVKIILIRAQLAAACVATYTYDFPAYNVPTTTSTTTTTTTSTTTTTTTTTVACPGTGWTVFNGYTYCYVSNSNTDGQTAQTRCQALGAIHSMAEDDFVNTFVGGSTVWLGGYRSCATPFTDTCFQNYDGTPFDYSRWAVSADNNGGIENCVLMNYNTDPKGTWNDYQCGNSAGYVCKRAA